MVMPMRRLPLQRTAAELQAALTSMAFPRSLQRCTCCCPAVPSTSTAVLTRYAATEATTTPQRRHLQQQPRQRGRRTALPALAGSGAASLHDADEATITATTAAAVTSSAEQPSIARAGKAPLIMPTPIPPSTNLEDKTVVEGLFANGALLIDKPLEWTSFDVCAKVRNLLRRFLGKIKVGHAGTLDPMATGLLIVCTGRGTKTIDTFVAMSKQYSGTIRIGEGTRTYDAEAEVSERLPWEHITDDQIRSVIDGSFMGEVEQVPPMYSAIKVNGQKLYHLAREGQTVEREARPITITNFQVTRDPSDPQNLHFVVDCSKGTYVRSLAYDVGQALGTVAHLTALRRESIGNYNVKDAWPLQELVQRLQPAGEVLVPRTRQTPREKGRGIKAAAATAAEQQSSSALSEPPGAI